MHFEEYEHDTEKRSTDVQIDASGYLAYYCGGCQYGYAIVADEDDDTPISFGKDISKFSTLIIEIWLLYHRRMNCTCGNYRNSYMPDYESAYRSHRV